MSKFQSTISVVAALASIFGAGAAGWKLSQSNTDVPPSALDQKIEQLEQKIEQTAISVPTQQTEISVPSNDDKPVLTEQKPSVIVQQTQPVAPVPPPPPAPSQE